MECPRPQPGQKSIPSILKTQNEKCVSVPGDINASNVNDAIQNVNSKYLNIFFVILFRLCDTTRAIPGSRSLTGHFNFISSMDQIIMEKIVPPFYFLWTLQELLPAGVHLNLKLRHQQTRLLQTHGGAGHFYFLLSHVK